MLKCDSFINHSGGKHREELSPKTKLGSVAEGILRYEAGLGWLYISFRGSLTGARIGSC